jgi:hypothetical protein
MLGAAQLATDYAVVSAAASAEETPEKSDSRSERGTPARFSALWVAAQLVPSPELVVGEGVGRFGLRWQVTPLLYSFGVYRTVSPWRSLVVEPLLRQSGSVELFVGPEYIFYGRSFADGLLWRIGARTYLPVIESGDDLSVSIGTSYFGFADRTGVAYELGVYTLFGIVGAQVTWSPTEGPARTIATLRLRYF